MATIANAFAASGATTIGGLPAANVIARAVSRPTIGHAGAMDHGKMAAAVEEIIGTRDGMNAFAAFGKNGVAIACSGRRAASVSVRAAKTHTTRLAASMAGSTPIGTDIMGRDMDLDLMTMTAMVGVKIRRAVAIRMDVSAAYAMAAYGGRAAVIVSGLGERKPITELAATISSEVNFK